MFEIPDFAKRLLEPIRYLPDSPYERGLALVGLSKAGHLVSQTEIDTAMDIATNFQERTLVAIAAALSGSRDDLVVGLSAMSDNSAPHFRLKAYIQRDLRIALGERAGDGGKALVSLWDMGDFS